MSIEELREALRTARDHIDMEALEISHCKDAALIRAAIQQAEAKPAEPVGYENEMGELIKFPPPCVWMGEDCTRKKAIANTPDCYDLLYTHPAPAVPDDVRRDAERYRWIRHADLDEAARNHWPSGEVPEGDEFDSAIDAAMLTAAQAQKP